MHTLLAVLLAVLAAFVPDLTLGCSSILLNRTGRPNGIVAYVSDEGFHGDIAASERRQAFIPISNPHAGKDNGL